MCWKLDRGEEQVGGSRSVNVMGTVLADPAPVVPPVPAVDPQPPQLIAPVLAFPIPTWLPQPVIPTTSATTQQNRTSHPIDPLTVPPPLLGFNIDATIFLSHRHPE